MLSNELKSGEHFQQIADHLSVVLALANADLTKFLFVNRAYEQIWGRSAESLYADSLSFLEGVHLGDRERLREALQELIKGVPIEGLECRVVRPDGSTCWVFCRGFPVRDAEGRIIRLVGSAEDITERKRAREELQQAYANAQSVLRTIRESEDRYRDLVEHSSDLICTHNTGGILLSVNEAPLRILGYTREEMVNRPLRDFVPPEAKPHCDIYLAQVQREGFAKGVLPVATKSGEVRLWEYNNTLRKDGVSSPTVRGIAHDVTEQKHAESALRRSEEKFAKAFRSSPVEMMITTLKEGRILDVNETFARNTGFSVDEVLGHTTVELGLWIDPPQRAEIAAEIHRDGRITDREIQIRAKCGEIGYKLYSAELIHINREPCLLAVAEDITQRKRAEEKLLRSEAFLAEGQRLSQTGSWSWNPATGEMFWSREMYRMLDVDPGIKPTIEIVVRRLHPEDRPIFERVVERIVREQCDSEGDYRVVMAVGAIKHVHCMSRPVFDAEGKLIEFVGTAMDVTERKRTEDELRRLSGQLLRVHDEERRSLARDLHDSTGQGLAALGATLSQLQAHIPSSNRRARKLISEAIAVARECLREVRTLSYVLYPPMLEQAGLEDAIRHFRDGFVGRTGIEVKLEISSSFERRFEPEAELALFRVVQESLANIQRHSGSRSAEILLDRQAGVVVLEVKDHGRGISSGPSNGNGEFPFSVGVGIASMQERVKQVGGRLEIKAGNDGTTVWAVVPVNGHEKS